MKRFLILFILIALISVSCAGPNKVGWTKRDFRRDQFEKDREECMQTLKNKSWSQTSGVVDDCLARKGYQYQPPPESFFYNEADEKITAETICKVLLGIALIPVVISLVIVPLGVGLPHGTLTR